MFAIARHNAAARRVAPAIRPILLPLRRVAPIIANRSDAEIAPATPRHLSAANPAGAAARRRSAGWYLATRPIIDRAR